MAELLAPAGNLAKLKLAFYFGADAVYLGGKNFSLRTYAENFTDDELEEGVAYAHARGKKVYVAANIFARNFDLAALREHFAFLKRAGADGVLVSDLGVFSLAMESGLAVHISTQANTTNLEAVKFWRKLGAKRVVLARELSLEEIARIHDAAPDVELEAFVHGAMCISYSGRCYLSDYMEGRPANRGACVQACRRSYRIQAREGENGDFFDVTEDGRGAYVLNSKDLNMSAHLGALERAGVSSFKIEGRMKGDFYLATVVNAYRRIMDGGYTDALGAELFAAAHRDYTTAYAFGAQKMQSEESSQTGGTYDFVAIVTGTDGENVFAEMRTRFFEGEELEILSPSASFGKTFVVRGMRDAAGEPCRDAKLVQARYTFPCPYPLAVGDLLRRKKPRA